jgi:hypothetical protein
VFFTHFFLEKCSELKERGQASLLLHFLVLLGGDQYACSVLTLLGQLWKIFDLFVEHLILALAATLNNLT